MNRTNFEIHLEKVDWFIRLRWVAVAAGLVLLLAGPLMLPLGVPYAKLTPCLFLLAVINLAYSVFWKGQKALGLPDLLARKAVPFLQAQVAVDLVLLTLVLFLTGGSENPMVLFYLFHLALSTILFSQAESLVCAGLVVALPWCLFAVERTFPREGIWADSLRITDERKIAFLAIYSIAAAGLWFFLSRLASDLRVKEGSLKEAGDELRSANEELKQLDVYKNRFLKQVVTQLKEPAMDVGMDLAAVERSISVDLAPGAVDAIETAKKRIWALLQLIEDLTWLSRARVQDLPVKPEPVDIYEALLKCVQSRESTAAAKGIKLQIHGDPQVRASADPEGFRRVADNLLANAIQYTQTGGGDVLLSFALEEDGLKFTVEDHGIGIPQKDQKKLFQEFYRGTNAKDQERFGTGLGLTIVKRILDLHGGRVQVISESKKGTRVETWWPLSAEK